MVSSRILIVQLADIGDLILSTPALAALREARPEAHIALLTTAHSAPVLEGTGLVNEVITIDRRQFNSSKAFLQPANLSRILALRHARYDTVIFFHHFTLKLGTFKFALIALATGAKRVIGLDNGNGWFLNERLPDGGFGAKHQAQYWLDLVGLVGADTKPRSAVVAVDKEYISKGGSETRPYSSPRIVIHPGSGGYSRARRWDADQFAVVADALHEQYGAQIVLVGGGNDDGAAVEAAMKTKPLNLTSMTTLAQLAGVIQSADLFIGADSGVMHIASAVGTPVIALFGPSNADAWGPWTPESMSMVIRSAPECSPCSYVGHEIGLREGCAARTCMRMVTAAKVLEAAKGVLEGKYTGSAGTGFGWGAAQQPSVEPSVRPSRQPASTKSVFPNRIHILGLPVDAITYAEWLDLIGEWVNTVPEVESAHPHHVCTINPEFIMIAQKDVNFRNILQRADLCIPDGVGLLWAARHLGKPLPERVTGSDGVPKIAEHAAQTGWRLFFLGAAPGVAQQAADILQERYPGLHIAGTYSGSPTPEEEDHIVEWVNASEADILFVAYGAPEQDKWIARNLPRLRVKMAMGVGGAFDFIAGVLPRAPLWMQRMGLEWLFRLYLQPRRIGRMMRLPRFVLAVILRGRG